MTSTIKNSDKLKVPEVLNKTMYTMFVFFALYYLFYKNEIGDAMSTLGLALIFDPFNQALDWRSRPRFQKIWLVAHAGCVLILLLLMI